MLAQAMARLPMRNMRMRMPLSNRHRWLADERRMQVRAYNFWTAQLGESNYPNVEELEPEERPGFPRLSGIARLHIRD